MVEGLVWKEAVVNTLHEAIEHRPVRVRSGTVNFDPVCGLRGTPEPYLIFVLSIKGLLMIVSTSTHDCEYNGDIVLIKLK